MKTILTAVDFSDVTDRVIDRTRELAKALGAGVCLLHVVSDTSYISGAGEVPVPWTVSDAELPKHFPSEEGKLREIVDGLKEQGVTAEHVLVSGPVIERVLTLAAQRQADMIIMGSHGHGALYNLLMGTISEGVMRKSEVPVLIVPSVKNGKKTEGGSDARDKSDWKEPMATPF